MATLIAGETHRSRPVSSHWKRVRNTRRFGLALRLRIFSCAASFPCSLQSARRRTKHQVIKSSETTSVVCEGEVGATTELQRESPCLSSSCSGSEISLVAQRYNETKHIFRPRRPSLLQLGEMCILMLLLNVSRDSRWGLQGSDKKRCSCWQSLMQQKVKYLASDVHASIHLTAHTHTASTEPSPAVTPS